MKTTKNINELTPIETALQQQFKPDAKVVKAAFQTVESDRAKFAINSVKFGLCALAAKAIVGHGKFETWISAALAENGNERPLAVSTAQDYIHTAAEFVEKLRNPAKLTGTLADAVSAFCEADENGRYEDFDIAAVLADTQQTDILLRIVFANMSIRSFRNLLRDGAERADSEKNAKQTALTKSDLRGLKGGETPKNPQMLLWEDWTNELENFDKLLEAPEKDLLDPEHWFQVENKLVVWLESVRKITKRLRK